MSIILLAMTFYVIMNLLVYKIKDNSPRLLRNFYVKIY